ncbi:ribonuclease HII [Desulfofalx alkaliphila]|uniref:ribonuclease HII n=1 Tax=Desulfofalx alkaliphila TaxID=105483 RepID=UPI0004E1CBB2|nr:ribonuclease HII [Desulfofalx alkaliphila]
MIDLTRLTVSEIKKYVNDYPPDEQVLEQLAADGRAGVRRIYHLIQNKREKLLREYQRLEKLFTYEQQLFSQGKKYIVGIDEVGRGPLAGPVVAGAVIFPKDVVIHGLNESKKVSAAKRRKLAKEIKEKAVAWSLGLATVQEINRFNIYQATLLAMRRAVGKLSTRPEHLLVDAVNIPGINIPQFAIKGGDRLSGSIAAASIIAKTYRDEMMQNYHKKYPRYQFDRHKGYPTKEHLEALKKYGPSPIHRSGYAPVAELIKDKLF